MWKSQYGETAIKAVEIFNNRKANSSREAWEKAAKLVIQNVNSRNKGCSRSAFLRLCEEGFIKGISKENYGKMDEIKNYTIDALNIIKQKPNKEFNPRE